MDDVKEKRNKYQLFWKLLALFVSISCAILTIDLLFQWHWKIPPRHSKKIIQYSSTEIPHKRLKKNLDCTLIAPFREFKYHVTTNQDGFRNNTPRSPENLSNYEIIFLGDSQTFGAGVNDNETFVSLISQELKKTILNTGTPGYNTIEQFQLAQDLLRKYKPKEVVLAFFIGNDPYENFKNRDALLNTENIETKKQVTPSFADLKNFLVRRSSLYNGLIRLRRFESVNRLVMNMNLVQEGLPGEFAVFEKNSKNKKKYWEITETALLDINRLVTENGAKFTLLILPDQIQVDSNHWQRWQKKYNLNTDDYNVMEPNSELRSFCKKNGISCIDATPFLIEKHKAGEKLFWNIDMHISPKGHKVISDILVKYFNNRNLRN